MPKKRSYSTSCWHHQIITWAHSSCGGRLSSYWKVPRGQSHDHGAAHSHSTLLTSASPLLCFVHNSGGQTFKASRKDEWPPRVECLTTTTWYSGGLLLSFTQGVVVAAINVRSHTKWVRRALQLGELMTAFEIRAANQGTFAPEVITQVCASLPTLTPVRVLRLFLSILVPLKGHSFMGGISRLEKLPSRQKVAMLETAKTRQPKPDAASIEAPLISPF
jgi:hypothetical protein